MNIYIATSLKRAVEHNFVRDALAKHGHRVSYDWTAHGSVQDEGPDRIREVAHDEMAGVQSARAVIVLLPGGRGTHAELGAALALDLPVLLHAETPETLLKDGKSCAFYSHRKVQHFYGPLDEAIEALTAAANKIQSEIGGPLCGAVDDLALFRRWKAKVEALSEEEVAAANKGGPGLDLIHEIHHSIGERYPLGIAEQLSDVIGALHCGEKPGAIGELDELIDCELQGLRANGVDLEKEGLL